MSKLADILEALTGARPSGFQFMLADSVTDVRQVEPGCAYFQVAISPDLAGELAAQAFEQGAALVVSEHDLSVNHPVIDLQRLEQVPSGKQPFCLRVVDIRQALQQIAIYNKRRFPSRVIGITGSVGKTTTKDLAVEILTSRYRILKNSGDSDSSVQVPLAWSNLAPNHNLVLLEIELEHLAAGTILDELTCPDIAVVTNISTIHAAKTGERAMLAQTATWLEGIPEDGYAIMNYDDPWVQAMAAGVSARIFTYGLNQAADLWASEVEGIGLQGIQFVLHHRDQHFHIKVPLIGRHSVHTALRAAAIGIVEGLSWEQIIRGLRYGNVQLRLVAVRSRTGALVLDDTYNASPESMLAALNLLAEMGGRKIAVLGGMMDLGPYERQGHEMVGLRASQVADILVTVGETGHLLASAARSAWMPTQAIFEADSYLEVLEFLQQHLTKQDVVLVKGPRALQMDLIAPGLEEEK